MNFDRRLGCADLAATIATDRRSFLKVGMLGSGGLSLAGLLAGAIVPVRRAILDVDGFDISNDDEFVARVDVPGLRRAGDFTTAAYMASGDITIHNAGDRFILPRVRVVSRRLTPAEIAAAAR